MRGYLATVGYLLAMMGVILFMTVAVVIFLPTRLLRR